MSAVQAISTKEEQQLLLDAARKKAEELRQMVEQIIGDMTDGVSTPVPPRPQVEVIGKLASGMNSTLDGLNGVEVNPASR